MADLRNPLIISTEMWAAWRPFLESPKAVAAELGMTTAELLASARNEQDGRRFEYHLIREGNALHVWRPQKGCPK